MTDENKSPAGQGGAQRSNFNSSSSNSTISQPKEEKTVSGDSELAKILSEMSSAIAKHLSLHEGAPDAMALWILQAHTLSAAEFAVRLGIVSPLSECGKTTLLRLLSALVPNPLACSNITPAAIYRLLESDPSRTLILDEADTYMDEQTQLKGILNSGHQRTTAKVVRCEKRKDGGYDPKEFPTFCPMIYARIGEPYPALLTRSIVIRMQRAKPTDAIAKIKPGDIDALEQLPKRISGNSAAWTARLKLAEPRMPRYLDNRSADNWRHMLAIAELAGHGWPSRAAEAARLLSPRADLEKGEEVLTKLKRVFDRGPDDKLSSAEICRRLDEIDEGDGEWTQTQLARELKPFGIYPKSIRIGEKTPKGYERSQFQDAWSRYLKPELGDHEGSV
jgi:putative DNA primase/helicase